MLMNFNLKLKNFTFKKQPSAALSRGLDSDSNSDGSFASQKLIRCKAFRVAKLNLTKISLSFKKFFQKKRSYTPNAPVPNVSVRSFENLLAFIEDHQMVQRDGPYRVNGSVDAVNNLLTSLTLSDSVGVDTPFTAATSAVKKIISNQFNFLKNELNDVEFNKFNQLTESEKDEYLIHLYSKICLDDKKILYRILNHLEFVSTQKNQMDIGSLGIVFQATFLGCFLKNCFMMENILLKKCLLLDVIILGEADRLASNCIALAQKEIAQEIANGFANTIDNESKSVVNPMASDNEKEILNGFQALFQSGKKRWFAFGNQYSKVPTSDPDEIKAGCRFLKIKWPWRGKLAENRR